MQNILKTNLIKKIRISLIWFCVWVLSVGALMGVNLSHAKADTLAEVQFNVQSSSSEGLESQKIPQIYISLDKVVNADVIVDISVIGGTATEGLDYELTSEEVTIAQGTLTASLPLKITDDNITELDETVEVTLSSPEPESVVIIGEAATFTYKILDNDQIVTKLTTDPQDPDGNNDWFISVPQITLDTATIHTPATIFYQWNDQDLLKWETYTDSFSALEGENTLYYYAVDNVNNTEMPVQSKVIKVDTLVPDLGLVTTNLTSDNYVKISWEKVVDADYYEIYRGGVFLEKVSGSEYLDKYVVEGQNYVYQVIAVDLAGNKSLPQSGNVFIPKPSTLVVVETASTTIQPAIDEGVDTYKAPQIIPEVKAAETITSPVSNENESEEESGSNWNKLLLAISILIIAAGAAVGGYYGYQWWMIKKDDEQEDSKKTNSRSRW